MAVALRLINYDGLYHTDTEKVILNDMESFSHEGKELIDKLMMKNYTSDSISITPSCSCGSLKGTYYVGNICKVCNTKVTSSVEDTLAFLLWLRQPEGVERFISPMVLCILLNKYMIRKPSVNLIKYIMLPRYTVDSRQPKTNMHLLEKLDYLLAANGIERGYNSFIRNFFKIIEILEENFVINKKSEKGKMMEFLRKNEHALFSSHLPFPNKVMFTMDTNELGKYIHRYSVNTINIVRTVTGIDYHTRHVNIKQQRIANSLIGLSEFYRSYLTDVILGKYGLVRQHISSSRMYFTARAVIISLHGPHEYDEIHFPWSMSCSLFREHILNRLYARGYDYKNALNLLMENITSYHPLLDEIFNELIAATKNGIRVLFNRNPSLHRGSIQAVRVTKVKTDPSDNTIGMSFLIARAFNADYDGDMMNITLPVTGKVLNNIANLEPHHSVLGMSDVNGFSNNIALPKTVILTMANWYNS